MIMNLNVLLNFCMMMGVIMTISSNNWFSIWMGLELTLMCFIPIMSAKSKLNSESCIKYFIMQSLSSSIMMMGVIMMSFEMNKYFLLTSIAMKLGVVPFHTWVLSITEGMKYYSILVFSTVMKLGPMMVMSYLNSNYSTIIIMMLILSSIAGLNQNSMKKVIMYSSLFNMSFMLSCINNCSIWMTYFILYSASLLMLTLMIMKMNLNFINQFIFNNYSNSMKLIMWMIMMSMGGMPPMLSFYGKFMVIKYLIELNNLIMIIFMITGSLIIIFFYMRMTFLSMMFFYHMPKWLKMNSMENSFIIMTTLIMPITVFNLKSL
uniref:NADH dehydrogenase subunit 2 n=1 Tax=Sinocentrus brevicornis TaxID=3038129 RepID=UPI002551F0EF|nr:NADH dehydrogenase subunit 2 [Sinocentrus brevicornis]WFD60953.1 NADH dehydrogenase subunit 2 [Sinocentrus brevicornis]